MNALHLIANLTANPELKYLPNGTALCEFSVAWNEVYYSGPEGNKQKVEKVHFFDLSAFGSMGENIAKYFTKGKPIAVTAGARQDRWDDKETGKKRSKIVFRVESWDFCGGDRKEGEPKDWDDAKNKAKPEVDETDIPL